MIPKHVAIVGFDEITSLDLTGPLEAFSRAVVTDSNGKLQHCYKVTIATIGAKTFHSEFGLCMTGSSSLDSLRHLDTLIVPGGPGMRNSASGALLANWIGRHQDRIRRIASVCTGIFGIAPTGLLNGRRVTTHWKYAADLTTRFPELRVDADALYIRDGKFLTSAGVTAEIDLSLSMIEEDFGPQVALAVARELVVYMKRPGGQQQFSEPLKFQAASTKGFADLVAWMLVNLDRDLSVEALAERMNLSPRQFSRGFTAEFNESPAAFVRRLRLEEARSRLSSSDCPVDSVANSVGFSDPDSFRRAFVQRYGVAPHDYRNRFSAKVRETYIS